MGSMTTAARVFTYPYRVTYADCTVGNHIYYGRYLALLEAARGEAFREWGIPFLELQEQDTIFPVLECLIQYRFPAAYDDQLAIETALVEAAGVRLKFSYRVSNQHGRCVLEGHSQHACTSLGGKPKRLPLRLLELLKRAP